MQFIVIKKLREFLFNTTILIQNTWDAWKIVKIIWNSGTFIISCLDPIVAGYDHPSHSWEKSGMLSV